MEADRGKKKWTHAERDVEKKERERTEEITEEVNMFSENWSYAKEVFVETE